MEGVNSKFAPKNKTDQTNIDDRILKQAQFRGWAVDRAPQIPRGNYDISKILELIKTKCHSIFSNKTINLKIDFYQSCVEIN